ncbi:MAG: VOC family protein [Candidatus Zixiibacteriota bacterium]
MKALFILYVADQEASASFYSRVLGKAPDLHVPGMTEFDLGDGATLGLMPARGIKRLLGATLPVPGTAQGIPRCELYLTVASAESYHRRALDAGARELSGLSLRAWGDTVAYSLDLDGHVLAFAERDRAARRGT